MPLALRLTLSTSSVCRSIDMFLWMTPMPPSWARAMAISLSVTVSMGELSSGMFSADAAGEPGADVDIGRHDLAVAGLQQHVVERQALIFGDLRHAP